MEGRERIVEHDHEVCAGVGLGHVLSAVGSQLVSLGSRGGSSHLITLPQNQEQLAALRAEMRKAMSG